MGVCLDAAYRRKATDEEITAGYAPEMFEFVSSPASPGYTYAHWRQILDDLMLLGETHVTMGTMPVTMLEIHLGLMHECMEARVVEDLHRLLQFCEENGYTHIGWA